MEKKNGLAIAALVLAIISVVMFWVPIVNFVAMFIALIGLVLGLCALGHPKKTMAIVSVSLCVIAFVGAIVINNVTSKAVNNAVDEAFEEVDEAFEEVDEAFEEVDEAFEEIVEDTEYVLFQSEIEEAVESTSVEVVVEPAESMTTGQKNALKSAKNYLSFHAFSYDGLVKQLEFEQYSHEDAVYAADNCGVDWFEQAAKSAEAYLEFSSFSKDGLIEQLEFEGFTHEQAVYGAEQNGY